MSVLVSHENDISRLVISDEQLKRGAKALATLEYARSGRLEGDCVEGDYIVAAKTLQRLDVHVCSDLNDVVKEITPDPPIVNDEKSRIEASKETRPFRNLSNELEVLERIVEHYLSTPLPS